MADSDVKQLLHTAKTRHLMKRFKDIDFTALDSQSLLDVERFSKALYTHARKHRESIRKE